MSRRPARVAPIPPLDLLAATIAVELWPAGASLYRVHSRSHHGLSFNPGVGKPSRFAFFGTPAIPCWYGASNPQAAVAESLLHDKVPGSVLLPEEYRNRVLSSVIPAQDLVLACLHSAGLRRLGLTAASLTDTPPTTYADTVAWAAAIHRARPDVVGLIWMARQWNSARSVVLYSGARLPDTWGTTRPSDAARDFALPEDVAWLAEVAADCDVTLIPDF